MTSSTNRSAFTGGIESGDFGLIRSVLEAWMGAPLKVKVKLSGEQLTYDDEARSLYCYRAYTTNPAYDEFLIEGRVNQGLGECRKHLEALIAVFQSHGVTSAFDYNEIDEAGETSGEQLSLP